MSAILFENRHYVVCLTRAGLTVQNKYTETGRRLKQTHAQYADYVQAFRESISEDESAALAGALFHA